MSKIKIFISSRVNSEFKKLDKRFSLKELRSWLKEQLEEASFLDEKLLDVVINETDFDSPIAKDAFDNCIQKMRSCNIIIILYNGEAGWPVAGAAASNGICHEEYLTALSEFSQMSFMMDLTHFFNLPGNKKINAQNDAFAKDVETDFGHRESITATTVTELKEKVLTQCKRYILAALESALGTQKKVVARSTVFGETLNWSKLSYAERKALIEERLTETFERLPDFADVIKKYHAIPDNMSVADARNMIGRPFIKEHEWLDEETRKAGVIHFVAVYGSATEIQAKSLVGYPDIAVIKAPFGFYLWEKNFHIQIFFLAGCKNPQSVKTAFGEVLIWLKSSKEQANILNRARSRFHILQAVNAVKNGIVPSAGIKKK